MARPRRSRDQGPLRSVPPEDDWTKPGPTAPAKKTCPSPARIIAVARTSPRELNFRRLSFRHPTDATWHRGIVSGARPVADITEDKRLPFCTAGRVDRSGPKCRLDGGGSHLDRGGDGVLAPIYLGCGACPWLLRQPSARSAAALEAELARRSTGSCRWLDSPQGARIGGPCEERLNFLFGTRLCRPIATPRKGEGRRV